MSGRDHDLGTRRRCAHEAVAWPSSCSARSARRRTRCGSGRLGTVVGAAIRCAPPHEDDGELQSRQADAACVEQLRREGRRHGIGQEDTTGWHGCIHEQRPRFVRSAELHARDERGGRGDVHHDLSALCDRQRHAPVGGLVHRQRDPQPDGRTQRDLCHAGQRRAPQRDETRHSTFGDRRDDRRRDGRLLRSRVHVRRCRINRLVQPRHAREWARRRAPPCPRAARRGRRCLQARPLAVQAPRLRPHGREGRGRRRVPGCTTRPLPHLRRRA